MPILASARSFLRNLFLPRLVDRDLDREVRADLDLLTDENLRAGMPPDEARRAARLELGGIEQVKEQVHDQRLGNWLLSMLADVRFALRQLRKNPGFTAVAVLTLALGIGANSAIFSVVSAVLFRALPYRDPGKLVWVTNFGQRENLVFADEYSAWRNQNHVFENVAAYSMADEYTLTGAGAPERLEGASVTASFLDVLGVRPQLGRNFLPEEDRPAGPTAVLLSDALWRMKFAADSNVVGRVIELDDTPYTVVGVLPQDFEFPDNSPAALLLPFQMAESCIQTDNGKVVRFMTQPLSVVARLRPGLTIPAVLTELNGINANVVAGLPGKIKGLIGEPHAQAITLHDHMVGNVRPAMFVLLVAVDFVLLIACANVANLQLARSVAREKEVAIRGALGAGRWRLARQLLTESAATALIGGAAGLLLARWTLGLIRHFAPGSIPHLQSARLDVGVVLFTLGLSLLTGILFGVAPVMAAFRVSVNHSLNETGQQMGSGVIVRRVQRVLMVAEIMLSFVLLVGAGLLLKSFYQLTVVQSGFDAHGVLTAHVALPVDRYQSADQQRTFYEQLVERLHTLPGVTDAAVAGSIPLSGTQMILTIQMEGQPAPDFNTEKIPTASVNVVTPRYFSALHIPLIEGRLLDERDGPGAPNAVVVNQAFVRRFLENEDPIGKRFISALSPKSGGPGNWTIVGVIGDTKQMGLASETLPEVTASVAQIPRAMTTFVVRSSVDPQSLASAVREQVNALDKNLPVYGVRIMDDVLSKEFASHSFNAGALLAFAGLAMLLAAVGIYGVIAYAVTQRTREIGIRIALGAESKSVLRMVLKQGLWLAVLGVASGLAAAFALTRLMISLLFAVKPTDPLTFAAVTLSLLAVAVAACWLPARRATRVDPVIALRYE